jgi:FO synthase
MNESISRAAGAAHGEELPPATMDGIIASLGRLPAQRTTLYAAASDAQRRASYGSAPLAPVVQTPAMPHVRHGASKRVAAASQGI